MASVVLVVHHDRPAAELAAGELIRWLDSYGHDARLPTDDAERLGFADRGLPDEVVAKDADLVVSLGGDGNMLRAVRLVGDHGTPLLGINFGQLGYLTEVEPAHIENSLRRFLSGDHGLEERMTLQLEIEGEAGHHRSLNEAVIEKLDSGKVVRLAVYLNDDFFTTYAADGLILATPTGSTAYNFSARGPIVDPTHRAVLLTPVAPHMLFDRSLVLSPDDRIRVEVLADRPASLVIDGRIVGQVEQGSAVSCTVSPHPAALVTFGERDFHRLLKAKFQLNDR